MVVSQWRRGGAEILHEHPVDAALQSGKTSVLVLPSRVPGQALVAHFEVKGELPARTQNTSLPAADPSVPEVTPRKAWWRKIVA
jgi:hypothetical protein